MITAQTPFLELLHFNVSLHASLFHFEMFHNSDNLEARGIWIIQFCNNLISESEE